MKEDMLYDTNLFQIRDMVVDRMKEIILNNRTMSEGGNVFFGDSLIEYYDLHRWFPDMPMINSGLAGITVSMLKHFIDEGVLKFRPKRVFLMAGTNDLGDTVQSSPRDIALNMKEIIDIIHENLPETKIYLLSSLPCVESMQSYQVTHHGIRTNGMLKLLFEEEKKQIHTPVIFINLYDLFMDGERVKEELFLDGLHVNEQGYAAMTNEIRRVLKEDI